MFACLLWRKHYISRRHKANSINWRCFSPGCPHEKHHQMLKMKAAPCCRYVRMYIYIIYILYVGMFGVIYSS